FRRLDGGWCPAAGRSEPRRASGWTAPRCGGPGGSAASLQPQELPPAAPSGPAPADSGVRSAQRGSAQGPPHGGRRTVRGSPARSTPPVLNREGNRPMSLVVQKFGGSSVADADSIKRVAKRIALYSKAGHKVVVVVSAM